MEGPFLVKELPIPKKADQTLIPLKRGMNFYWPLTNS
jgi:hypothetical protein